MPRLVRRSCRKRPLFLLASLLVGFGMLQVLWVGTKLPPFAIQDPLRIGSSRRWAYVFLLADCNPNQQKPSYMGMYYNILAARHVLQTSEAETIVMVQMSADATVDRLPRPQEELLELMQIQIKYLPSPASASMSFYELVMAKFAILQWTEYSKLMFLDGDVLPLCSLDYLMELSETGQLRSTVLHAMYEDPVNAGLWIVTPQPGDYERVTREIQWNANEKVWTDTSNNLSVSSVDYRLWDGTQVTDSPWDFYCGNADQGLLLFWSRFVKQDVSIIVGPNVEHYTSLSGQPSIVSSDLLAHSSFPTGGWARNAHPLAAQLPFYRSFFHMVGYSKAWERPLKGPLPTSRVQLQSSAEYWYFVLQQVIDSQDPNHDIIPPIEQIYASIDKPKIRGDLFAVVNKTTTGTRS